MDPLLQGLVGFSGFKDSMDAEDSQDSELMVEGYTKLIMGASEIRRILSEQQMGSH